MYSCAVTFTGDTSGLRGALISVQLPSSTKETLSSIDPDDSSLGFSTCLQFSVLFNVASVISDLKLWQAVTASEVVQKLRKRGCLPGAQE